VPGAYEEIRERQQDKQGEKVLAAGSEGDHQTQGGAVKFRSEAAAHNENREKNGERNGSGEGEVKVIITAPKGDTRVTGKEDTGEKTNVSSVRYERQTVNREEYEQERD
jgi:hypothetical protein